jgi:hypothetical protein
MRADSMATFTRQDALVLVLASRSILPTMSTSTVLESAFVTAW